MASTVSKLYSEMTPLERIQDRIARNKRIDQAFAGKAGLNLRGVVARLDAQKQRATYGAVAGLVGVLPRGLMGRRPKGIEYSWVVAGTTAKGLRRGRPTGYTIDQIHPDCYRQIRAGDDNIIDSPEALREWFNRKP
jgi:hypothetical protein